MRFPPALLLLVAITAPAAAQIPSVDGTIEHPARIGGNVLPPKVLKHVDPQYSEEARRQQLSGTVLLSFVVDEKGLPQKIQVIRGIGHGLDEKAIEAVQQYRFQPAMRDGTPVSVQLKMEVRFEIYRRN